MSNDADANHKRWKHLELVHSRPELKTLPPEPVNPYPCAWGRVPAEGDYGYEETYRKLDAINRDLDAALARLDAALDPKPAA